MNFGTIQRAFRVAGQAVNKTDTLTGEGTAQRDLSVDAAKAGELTTRTDNNTGELTMVTGHGITTGQIVSVFWADGHRRGMTVGTVAGLAVPIDGGLGDNLPTVNEDMTVMVEQVEDLRFDGDDLVALVASCAAPRSVFILTGDDNVEDFAIVLPFSANEDAFYGWPDTAGTANPVAGDTITKVRLAHSAESAQTMKIAAGLAGT